MKIYFDNCCYGRPFDDQSQEKIRNEAAAIQNIVMMAQWYKYTIFESVVLDMEIGKITARDVEKHADIRDFYQRAVGKAAHR